MKEVHLNDMQKAVRVLPARLRSLTLPEICIKVHMHTNGSSDALTANSYLSSIEYIENRIHMWMHTNYEFDSAVRMLCRATVKEAKESSSYNLALHEGAGTE